MPCLSNSFRKELRPRHAWYCGPWSLSTSSGLPYFWTPSIRQSATHPFFADVDRDHDTMKREWSSMNATRYTRTWWRVSTKLVMSVCQSSPGRLLSNRLTSLCRRGFLRTAAAAGSSTAASRSTVPTLPALTRRPRNRASQSPIRSRPKIGKRRFASTTAAFTASGSLDPVPDPFGRPSGLVSRPLGPFASYSCFQRYRLFDPTPTVAQNVRTSIPDFAKDSRSRRRSSGLYRAPFGRPGPRFFLPGPLPFARGGDPGSGGPSRREPGPPPPGSPPTCLRPFFPSAIHASFPLPGGWEAEATAFHVNGKRQDFLSGAHTHDRRGRVGGTLIDVEDVLHPRDVLAVAVGRNHPPDLEMG
jgi:hypothetical protein